MTYLNLIRPVISAFRAISSFMEDAHYACFVYPYEESLARVKVRVDSHLE